MKENTICVCGVYVLFFAPIKMVLHQNEHLFDKIFTIGLRTSLRTRGWDSNSPVPWAGISRPSEPSPRKYFHASDYSHGSISRVFHGGAVRGVNLQGRITSLLLYILVPVLVKYPPMELGG